MPYRSLLLSLVLSLCVSLTPLCAQQSPKATLLVDVDHRTGISLNGDWHIIVDPYATGLYTFHNQPRSDGYFMNAHPQAHALVEYDFAKSPTLKVPGDWNTQRDSLFYYEGLLWYQRDFQYAPKPHTRVFLHIGAANYRSDVWVNTQKVCEHEGGFTPFDCEVTSARTTVPTSPSSLWTTRGSTTAFLPARPIGGTTAASPATSLSSKSPTNSSTTTTCI